jgi:hypothetical protein
MVGQLYPSVEGDMLIGSQWAAHTRRDESTAPISSLGRIWPARDIAMLTAARIICMSRWVKLQSKDPLREAALQNYCGFQTSKPKIDGRNAGTSRLWVFVQPL